MRIRMRGAAAASIAVLALSGCAVPGVVSSSTCIDWVYFETPADAAADADAVVRGSIVEQTGNTTYMDMPATIWTVEVDDWIESDGDAAITVTSLPRSCGDGADAFASYQQVDDLIFFLRDDASGWQNITPLQGIVPAGPDGAVPAEWPEGSDD